MSIDSFYYFAAEIHMVTVDQAAWIVDAVQRITRSHPDEPESPGFLVVHDKEQRSVLFDSDAGIESDAPQQILAAVMQEFLKTHRPDDCLSFSWSVNSMRSLPNGSGGGAYFVTAEAVERIDTDGWMNDRFNQFTAQRSSK